MGKPTVIEEYEWCDTEQIPGGFYGTKSCPKFSEDNFLIVRESL